MAFNGESKGMKFSEIRHNPNMGGVAVSRTMAPPPPVPSVFPSSGASMLSREIDVMRGKLNKQTNKLISSGSTDEVKKSTLLIGSGSPIADAKTNPLLFKSDLHQKAFDITSEAIEGKRFIMSHPDGSVTISKKKDDYDYAFPTENKETKPFKTGDGVGDFGRSSFASTTTTKKNPFDMRSNEVRELNITNRQPFVPTYIPTGDNIDVATNPFESTIEAVENDEVAEPEENLDLASSFTIEAEDDEDEYEDEPEEAPEEPPEEPPEEDNINVSGLFGTNEEVKEPEEVVEPVEEIQVPNEEELSKLSDTKLFFRAVQSGIKLPVNPTKEELIKLIMEYGDVKKNTTEISNDEWNDMLQKPRTKWKRKEKEVDRVSDVEDVKEPEGGLMDELSKLSAEELYVRAVQKGIALPRNPTKESLLKSLMEQAKKGELEPEEKKKKKGGFGYIPQGAEEEKDDEVNELSLDNMSGNQLKAYAKENSLRIPKNTTKDNTLKIIKEWEERDEDDPYNLQNKTPSQLRKMAKDRGIDLPLNVKGYEIIEHLTNFMNFNEMAYGELQKVVKEKGIKPASKKHEDYVRALFKNM
jgi:hypothetical protein